MSIELTVIAALTPVVAEVIHRVKSALSKESPLLVKSDSGDKLQRPDKRISLGVTKRDGEGIPVLLVERGDGSAYRKAKEIQDVTEGPVEVIVTGTAQSVWPEDRVEQTNGERLRPGLSIGHYSGFAGTLGCLVKGKNRSGKGEWLGFVGASHVIAMMNTGQKGDAILRPGYPDGPKDLDSRVGGLRNYTFLVHHQNVDRQSRSFNTEDVAVVEIDDERLCPSANLVPKPDDLDHRIKIKNCVAPEDLTQLMGQRVFKVGRSGLSEGTLHAFTTEPHAMTLPDRRIYFYENTLTVHHKGTRAFSQPGDSGSLVYTQDGKGVGLIIGASPEFTYLSPLASCLKTMNVDLLV